MIVIADRGPINYLILIDAIAGLPALYNRVLIPQSVFDELGRERASEAVRTWISSPPPWLVILVPTGCPDAELTRLHAGERDAILLAEELEADQIVIDEIRGRQVAERRHLFS